MYEFETKFSFITPIEITIYKYIHFKGTYTSLRKNDGLILAARGNKTREAKHSYLINKKNIEI